MKFFHKNSFKVKSQKKKVFEYFNLKKKNSYKKMQNFSINSKNIDLSPLEKNEKNYINLNSYKELVKSFLIKSGNSKQLQKFTLHSLLHLWKKYPKLSLKKNINTFFFLYPFPLTTKVTFPIFKKRRSKKGFDKLQWLGTNIERKYIFNFFKDFFNKELGRNFKKIFILIFLKLSSKKVSLLKKHKEISEKFNKYWKPKFNYTRWKGISNNKKILQNLLKKKNYWYLPQKKLLQGHFFFYRSKKSFFLDLNFLPSFTKKKLWSSTFLDVVLPEGFFIAKSLVLFIKKYKIKKLKERRESLELKKKRRRKALKKWSYAKWRLNKKKGTGWKLIQSKFKKLSIIKQNKKIFYKRLKYYTKKFFRPNIFFKNKESALKSSWLKKNFMVKTNNIYSNRLFYNFLNNKYLFKKEVYLNKNITSYFLKRKCLHVTLMTYDYKSLSIIEKFLVKNYTIFFKSDNIFFKVHPTQKTMKTTTLLKSPHVNKKAQQHFSKVIYKKSYSFIFDSNKHLSLQKLQLIIHRLVTLNFVNLKFKIKYFYC